MKILTLFLLVITLSCVPKNNKFQQSQTFFKAVEIKRPVMEQFVNYLPLILKKAEQFKQLSYAQKLTDEQYNNAFYRYIFQDPNLMKDLQNIGFINDQVFGSFYNSVLESYILIQEKPEIVKDAVQFIPEIQSELNPLLIKQARDKNNDTLNKAVESLEETLIFYKNIVLIDQFVGVLNSLDDKK